MQCSKSFSKTTRTFIEYKNYIIFIAMSLTSRKKFLFGFIFLKTSNLIIPIFSFLTNFKSFNVLYSKEKLYFLILGTPAELSPGNKCVFKFLLFLIFAANAIVPP